MTPIPPPSGIQDPIAAPPAVDTLVAADGATGTALVDAIVTPTPGLVIDPASIVVVSAPGSIAYYNGGLTALGVGPGLLITSGTTPGFSNTVGWFGQDNGMAGDADLDAVINPVFQTMSYDATSISFNFEVTDPSITGISFSIVFGTDEYPEWVDQFVDIAAIVVNGVNVAFFGNDPNAPLSVISQNLAAGYFINNADGHLPIEYDGVSHVLTVFAPVHMGTNSIKIAIADTGDHIYDSGLFISGFHGTNLPTSGVSQDVPCTEGNDDITGDSSSEVIKGLGGDDHLDGGGGDDVIAGGSGTDFLQGGSGKDFLDGGAGHDSVDGGLGDDTLQFSGDDVLNGGDGVDTMIIDLSAGATGVTLDFSNPAAVQTLPDGSTVTNVETVSFTGGSGADLVTGGGNADTLNGGLGNDRLAGGAGDDAIDGGIGDDIAVFSGASFNYKITATVDGFLVEDLRAGAPDGTDKVSGVETFRFSNGDFDPATLVSHGETILGTTDDDVLGGSAFDDNFMAGAGDDIVNSLGGNDQIDLGADNDIVHAGAGDDVIIGGLGDDEVWGDEGVDTIVLSGNFADYAVIEQGDGYRITDLRPGSPDGRDQVVGVEYAAFADGTVKLTIGSPPVIETSVVGGQFTEPGAPAGVASVAGQIVFSDNDHDDTHTLAVVGSTGDQSGLTFHTAMNLDAGGGHDGQVDWSLDIDTAVIDALGEGQVRTVTYTVRVTDSAGNSTDQDVTVEITGTNDAPVVSGDILAAVTGATGAVTVNPLANASDADLGAKLHIAAAPDPLPAGVVFDPVAQTFSVDPADPALLAATGGGDATLTINYMVTDGLAQTPARIIFQVTGSGPAGVTIVGTKGNDVIDGVSGPAGQPKVTQAADTISGGAGNDTISGLGGGDTLRGEAGNDSLNGGLGPDTLDGGLGNDLLSGGAGDDVIVIRGAEALKDVIDGGSGGETLGDAVRVEDLASVSLTGFDAVARGIERWIGNGQGVVGTSAADRFDLGGLTQVSGLAFVDAGGGNDILIGSAFADDLRGGSGNDDLDGGGGADILQGGVGNDVYHVDNLGDLIVEAAASGTDTVLSSIDFSLAGTNLEHLTIVGATGRTGTGNALANLLTGGAGADTLNGDAGNDTLDGGAGADTLAGGLGDDIFLVDDAGDLVVEAANGGRDTVRATAASYALGANIEALTYVGGGAFTGVGNDLANTITGGAGNDALDGGAGDDKLYGGLGADSLVGGAGRDTLDGGAGADSLAGGLGNDSYVIDDALDQILELAGGGTDSAKVTAASWTMSDQVETLTFTGAGDFSGTGNALANTITGGDGADSLYGLAGADRLNGGAGDDQLIGGLGADTLTGGLGADVFVFTAAADSLSSGQDRIVDFSRLTGDRIDLSQIDADPGLAGDQAFTFLGAAGFTHHAGEVRYAIAAGVTTVSVDINGDGVADMAFKLTGAIDLTGSDFFL